MKSEVWIPFDHVSNITAQSVMAEIQKVQQSNEEFGLEDGRTVLTVIHVKIPIGSGQSTNIKSKENNLSKKLYKSESVVTITNDVDSMCLSRAIAVGQVFCAKPTPKTKEWSNKWKNIRGSNKNFSLQTMKAEMLYEKCGFDPNQSCGPEEWKALASVIPERLKIYEHRTSDRFLNLLYDSQGDGNIIHVLYHNHHYDFITSMKGYLTQSYYCEYCDRGYDHLEEHRGSCQVKCNKCLHSPPCLHEEVVYTCQHCHGKFHSKNCFDNHLKSIGNAKSMCERMGRCKTCSCWIPLKYMNRHQCTSNEVKCRYCKEMKPWDHKCFVQKVNDNIDIDMETEDVDPTDSEPMTIPYIFFDFECQQETGEHIPNFCVAHRACAYCIGLPIDIPCTLCDQRQHVFSGPTTLKDFLDWLFECKRHKKATVIAHNFSGYDGQFILRHLTQTASYPPKLIMNGSKILSMEAYGLRFIDSYSFINQPLSKFPKAYGLDELKKGYFPYLFNTTANQEYVGPYPDPKYYDPEGMTKDNRDSFYRWYEGTSTQIFDFQKEMLAYCRSDVDILRRGCAKFREAIVSDTGVEPFQECITIASMANRIYRKTFMPEDSIAIVPVYGYEPAKKYSKKALRWLKGVAEVEGIHIKHAMNGGEVKVAGHYVDGFDPVTNIIYEFHGCLFHSCPQCYPNQERKHPIMKHTTFSTIYQHTLQRQHELCTEGYQVIEMWEHEFDQRYRKDQEYKAMIDSYDIQDPLMPRDALFGGRTNATRLLHEAVEDEEIRYIDVCSLYPFVLKYGTFPLDHPELITENFKDVREYEGLIKCRILPPRQLYHPVLPYRSGGKLTFPLCRTCTETRCTTSCSHSDTERMLDGTWVSVEVKKALEMGYSMVHIFEVWHFKNTSKTLFKDYIDTFLKQKQEASGYPSWVQSEEDRERYKQQYFDIEGIQLENVEKNPTKRSTAKAKLNVLWGKFAQRLTLTKTEYIKKPAEFYQRMTDDTINISHLEILSNEINPDDDILLVNYTEKEEYLDACPFGNVVLAAYTTAQARLHLYSTLQQLDRRVLYFDTDSIIYIHKNELPNPVIEERLGGWTNELPEGHHITRFVSGGPKNYGYEVSDGSTVCKVKGLTLNYRASQVVNFELMINMMKEKNGHPVYVTNPCKILRENNHKVVSKQQRKLYRIVYDKRRICKNLDTLPFGYTDGICA